MEKDHDIVSSNEFREELDKNGGSICPRFVEEYAEAYQSQSQELIQPRHLSSIPFIFETDPPPNAAVI